MKPLTAIVAAGFAFTTLNAAALSQDEKKRIAERGLWQLQIKTHPMDQVPVMTLWVDGAPEVPGASATPSLNLRCSQGKAELIIDTETILEVDQERSMRIRIDTGKPEPMRGSQGTNHRTVFVSRTEYWLQRFTKASAIMVEVTPFRRGPAQVVFPVHGLGWYSQAIQKHCRIRLPS